MPFSDAIPVNRMTGVQTPFGGFGRRNPNARGKAYTAKQSVNISKRTYTKAQQAMVKCDEEARAKLANALQMKAAYTRMGAARPAAAVGRFLSVKA